MKIELHISGVAAFRQDFSPAMAAVPSQASAAVLQPSEPVSSDAISVKGPQFDNNLSLQDLLQSYERIGFQATSLGRAIRIVDKMVSAAEDHLI